MWREVYFVGSLCLLYELLLCVCVCVCPVHLGGLHGIWELFVLLVFMVSEVLCYSWIILRIESYLFVNKLVLRLVAFP